MMRLQSHWRSETTSRLFPEWPKMMAIIDFNPGRSVADIGFLAAQFRVALTSTACRNRMNVLEHT